MKVTTLLAFLSGSGQVLANEIDDLINASQSIRDTFKQGIKIIGGMEHYAYHNGIAPQGATEAAKVTYNQADAYNNALIAVQNKTYTYNPNAEQYFQDAADSAINEMSVAIDTYVEAAQVLIEVATVNEMAQDAAAAGDDRQAMELQEYIEANDVVLSEAEVDFYNESLEGVESAAQVAAAYMTIANDETLLEQANASAYDMRVTYAESNALFFDVSTGLVTVGWNEMSTIIDLSGYFKSVADLVSQGEQSIFFTTSPEGGCWFQPNAEECLNGS